MWNSTFTDGRSRFTPGGINAGDDVTIHGSRFERNFSSSGAAAVNALGDVSISKSQFVTNGTSGALGGVVSGHKVEVHSSRFDDGNAGFGDGGFVGGETVRVRSSSFSNGRNFGHGGTIAGTDVDVKTSTFSQNSASDGGAIATTGSLTIDRSTFAGNFTNEEFGTASGGAVFQSGTGPVKITNSTFTQNHGTATRGDGTAIATSGPVQLTFVTVSGNPTSDQFPQAQIAGNGVGAALTTFGSVFADAGAGGNCSITATTSQGFNYSDDGSCALTQLTDHTSAPSPQLGALASNGGPTQTLLPAATSPLLDTIPRAACPLPIDQRGARAPAPRRLRHRSRRAVTNLFATIGDRDQSPREQCALDVARRARHDGRTADHPRAGSASSCWHSVVAWVPTRSHATRPTGTTPRTTRPTSVPRRVTRNASTAACTEAVRPGTVNSTAPL